MNMKYWSLDKEALESWMCSSMGATIETLKNEKLILNEVADKFLLEHSAIILTPNNTYVKLRKLLFGEAKDLSVIKVVKV